MNTGDNRMYMRAAGRQSCRGAAVFEWLVSIPIVLIIGLGAMQWVMVIQAKQALHYAVAQGVRHAVREHGNGRAVNDGLAVGLAPFWLVPPPAAQGRLSQALSTGWVSWERVHPVPAVFADHGEQARTASGDIVAGDVQVPNDSLRYRDDSLGAASGMSVQEANRFQLALTYGVELSVPVINALTVRILEIIDGCRAADWLQLVVMRLGRPERQSVRNWTCGIYRMADVPGGAPAWRLPVRVQAEGWMQSPLRRSAAMNSASQDGEATTTTTITYRPAPAIVGPDVFSAPPISDGAPVRGQPGRQRNRTGDQSGGGSSGAQTGGESAADVLRDRLSRSGPDGTPGTDDDPAGGLDPVTHPGQCEASIG